MKVLVCVALLFACAFGAQRGLKIEHRKEPRVVGGEAAALGEFPHQLSLQWGFFGFYQHVCGATILSETYAVSAAHCFTEIPAGEFRVIAGIASLAEQDNGQIVTVADFTVHESFGGGVGPNDIAIIRLASALTFDANVAAAKLPSAGAVPSGNVQLSGWGSISNTDEVDMPNDLQKATLPVLSHEECSQALIAIQDTSDPLAESNVCTGPLDGTMSACSGDSGGPLIQEGTLIGIVSWGFFPCGTAGAPSVYTKVSSFIDWINNHMN